jgi:ankyrin repeat protein
MRAAMFLIGVVCLTAATSYAQDQHRQFFKAVRSNDSLAVEQLLLQGLTPDLQDEDGTPALMVAARHGADKVLLLLLERGSHPPLLTGSALMLISRVPGLRKVGILNVTFPACRRYSPTDLARALLDKGAPPTLALISASECSHAEMVSLLLDRGAEVNTVGLGKETALLAATGPSDLQVRSGNAFAGPDTTTIQLLIEHGANVNARGADNDTPLIRAARFGFVEKATLLLDEGADANAANESGDTPLIVAARNGFDKLVTLLLARGADPAITNSKGETAKRVARGPAKKALASARAP